jgi:hypothetical protein
MKFKVLCVLLILPVGQCAALAAGHPQASSSGAGTVSAVAPAVTVQGSGGGKPWPVHTQSPVCLGDVVRTLDTGLVQISLRTGSTLNVSPFSELKIEKDATRLKQTIIALLAG